jgi:hypothetical protein
MVNDDKEPVSRDPPQVNDKARRYRIIVAARNNIESSGLITGRQFLLYLLGGWLVQLVFSFSQPDPGASFSDYFLSGLHSFCVLWFVGSGGYFLGVLGGFLFGFPKAKFEKSNYIQGNPSTTESSLRKDATRDNTNLEDISDWLTKIIVGLGLANFRSFFYYTDKFGTYVGNSVKQGSSDITGGYVVAIASALYGFACGFIFFYVWARSDLARLFSKTPDPRK